MIGDGLHLKLHLVPRPVEFFTPRDGVERTVPPGLDAEISKEPTLGVVPVQDFTQPIHQQAWGIGSRQLDEHLLAGIDRVQIDDQVNQRAGGIREGFLAGRAGRLKADIRRVFQNPKGAHLFIAGRHPPEWFGIPSESLPPFIILEIGPLG